MSFRHSMNTGLVSCIALSGVVSAGDIHARAITCNFNKALVVYLTEPERMEVTNIMQTMQVNDGKTTTETLKLDGKLRATNSVSWELLRQDAIDPLNIEYVGSFGDLLALTKESKSMGKTVGSGIHSASLSSTVGQMVVVKRGSCEISEK